jgi:nucleoside-diphosphate kinase
VFLNAFLEGKPQNLQVHYAEHKDRSFFAGLVNYMASGPVCAMVWEGLCLMV